MAKGKARRLEEPDLFPLCGRHTTSFLGNRLSASWASAVKAARESGSPLPHVWRHALWPYRWEIVWVLVLMVVESGQRLGSSILLREILLYLQGSQSALRGYGLAVAFAGLSYLYPVIHHMYFGWTNYMGWNLRVQAMALVNEKLLALTGGAVSQITTGHCINLMSSDVRRFDDLINYGPFLILAPLELGAVAVLVGREMGVRATLAGMAALLALIPLQAIFAHFQMQQRRKTVKYTDQRVKMAGEVLNGILAVKMFAWENPFTAAIERVREKELKHVRWAAGIKAFNEASYFSGAAVVALATFSTFHAMGGVLRPYVVFYVLSLLQLPRLYMCVFFPFSIEKIAESSVSFMRLQRFLQLPELVVGAKKEMSTENITGNGLTHGSQDFPGKAGRTAPDSFGYYRNTVAKVSEPSLIFSSVTCSWSSPFSSLESSDRAVLRRLWKREAAGDQKQREADRQGSLADLCFEVGEKELLGVAGKVGSGKSTLLSAILGDLHVVKGSIQVNAAKIAYAAQKPFIIAGSLRDNILFGSPFDAKRYHEVLEECALVRDISFLPEGDLTEIGERGINLSGGQKARVGLARAAYAESDLVLLDDPISAVDPQVGRHLFERCIRGLMAARPRILVTHQLHFLPRCDRILLLEDGHMSDVGTFEELKTRVDFHGFIDLEEQDVGEKEGEAYEGGMGKGVELDKLEDESEVKDTIEKKVGMPHNKSVIGPANEEARNGVGGLVEEERREEGNVGWSVYWQYGLNMGVMPMFTILILLAVGQAALCIGDWFLAHWAQQKEQGGFWLATYAGIVVAGVAVSFGRSALFFWWAVSAASRIHSSMLSSIAHAQLSFFHKNPIGRILNRFSADQGVLDDMLPGTLFNTLQLIGVCGGAVIVVSIGVPWVTLGFLPVLFIFLHLRKVFLCASREVKRLEGTTRSPVFAHYAAAIQGLSTIRAFGVSSQFNAEFQRRLDTNSRAYFAWITTGRWLAFRLDFLCATILLAATLLAVAARDKLSVTLVGLALTYILQLSGQFQWCVRQSAEAENMFTGVERALEYTRIPPEGLKIVPSSRPSPDWPQNGQIEMRNLTVRYRKELKPVLLDICFTVQGGEKCGIVGRTGAGKSTLMLALFRLVEATSGCVLIDGLDIASIGLQDLRQKVMAIPQDPVLFGGSLRFNVDPFNECSDGKLWWALEAVQLRQKVETLKAGESGLDTSLAEFGDNFSVGERQLVCLARAILHHNKILVMDEATANVDLETDRLIRTTLHDKFRDSTVLMIAHRMDTIIDAHKVLVLSHGRVEEFGSPHELLGNPQSAFSGMLAQTGAASEAILRQQVK